jgi:hypothetical protein
MKSVYKQARKNSTTDSHRNEHEKSKKSERELVTELLKNQFKLESKVVFPRCKTKVTDIQKTINPNEGESGKKEGLESALVERV